MPCKEGPRGLLLRAESRELGHSAVPTSKPRCPCLAVLRSGWLTHPQLERGVPEVPETGLSTQTSPAFSLTAVTWTLGARSLKPGVDEGIEVPRC